MVFLWFSYGSPIHDIFVREYDTHGGETDDTASTMRRDMGIFHGSFEVG